MAVDVKAKAQTFRVHGYEGPLIHGERERAAERARALPRDLAPPA